MLFFDRVGCLNASTGWRESLRLPSELSNINIYCLYQEIISTQKWAKDTQMSPNHQDTVFHADYSREANWHLSQGSTCNQLDKNCFLVCLSSMAVLTPRCRRLPGEESASQNADGSDHGVNAGAATWKTHLSTWEKFFCCLWEVSNQLGAEIKRNRLTRAVNCWGLQSTCFCNGTLTKCVFTREFKLESSSMDLALILKKKSGITANLFLSKW